MDKTDPVSFIRRLCQSGGPQPEDYPALTRCFEDIHDLMKNGTWSDDDLRELWQSLGEPFTVKTLQGFVCAQPHGYAGDFEIIDRIYTRHCAAEDHLKGWDEYFHDQSAPGAVRNRKAYFITLMNCLLQNHPSGEPFTVLNIASGPGRDLREFFEQHRGNVPVRFDCVDLDPQAIAYARKLCDPYRGHLRYYQANVLRFQTDRKYRLVWSAGLFDYLTDEAFRYLLRKMATWVEPGGEIIIGNFSPDNPTRAYMEFAKWYLHHRSPEELVNLALKAGLKEASLRVEQEPEGVNLFLRITAPRSVSAAF
jgi:SAM-dependent methyltransferase